jgi:hypothetical protein
LCWIAARPQILDTTPPISREVPKFGPIFVATSDASCNLFRARAEQLLAALEV